MLQDGGLRRNQPAFRLGDIRVRFGNYKISRVHLEPEGVDLPMHRQGEATEVNVPKLEIHSMVVAELE